jgi:hypothetical protein
MGMDLHRAGGDFWFNIFSWGQVLELAQQYGWEPAGTEMQPTEVLDADGNIDHELTDQFMAIREDWDGNYVTNDWQHVSDDDAAHIADALERALDDIPDFDSGEKAKKFTPDEPPVNPVARALLAAGFKPFVASNDLLSPVEFFSGEGKQKIRDFIDYCRAGGFEIG